MNFKQSTTHILILSVIQRGALKTHCIQHWSPTYFLKCLIHNEIFHSTVQESGKNCGMLKCHAVFRAGSHYIVVHKTIETSRYTAQYTLHIFPMTKIQFFYRVPISKLYVLPHHFQHSAITEVAAELTQSFTEEKKGLDFSLFFTQWRSHKW